MSNGGGGGRRSRAVYRWACALGLATAGVAGVTVAVLAEEATKATQAAAKVATTTATESRHQRQGGRVEGAASRPWRVREEAGGRASRRAVEGPTEEEWREVVGFMARYSPNRLKAIEEQGAADGPRFANLRRFVWMHYKDLVALKEKGDQELYDLRVRMAQAEDEVFGLQRQLRGASESDRPVVRHELRQKVTELVRLGLKERELRIARLEKALDAEKAKLADDEQSVDQRVQERMQQMTKGMRKRDDGGGRGPGAATNAVGSEVK